MQIKCLYGPSNQNVRTSYKIGSGYRIKPNPERSGQREINGIIITHGTFRYSKKPVSLPGAIKERTKCQSESFSDEINGKSRFKMDGEVIKLNQHSVKCVFDDFSYIIFKKDTAEVYGRDGSSIGLIRHGNKGVLK